MNEVIQKVTSQTSAFCDWTIVYYNYPPKGRWIVVDIYRAAKRRGIYPPLFTDPEGDSCFSIYQIRWIKKRFFNFFFWNFRETTRHFSLRSQNSEYPRIFQVTGANQNARKLLSTDLVNTNIVYTRRVNCYSCVIFRKRRKPLWQFLFIILATFVWDVISCSWSGDKTCFRDISNHLIFSWTV